MENSKHGKLDRDAVNKILFFVIIILVVNMIFALIISYLWSVLDFLVILGLSLLTTSPAFFANGGMTFTGKGDPIDRGKFFIDGKRIFGEGKTWSGLLGGILAGLFIGFMFTLLFIPVRNFAGYITNLFEWDLVYVSYNEVLSFVHPAYMEILTINGVTQVPSIHFGFVILGLRLVLLSIAAPFGDLIGSFLKRRIGKERGEILPVIDQIDFITFSILITYPIFPLRWYYIVTLLLITPLIALIANYVIYRLGKKEVPW
ncbi:MAG: CDP-archaeol synthase [Candidatus Lokiarchaeota archaeon]|nr:CDP-archaeol synthase [Candidatus Lokiarchaeota archaeon]